jgi:hypothetical protein
MFNKALRDNLLTSTPIEIKVQQTESRLKNVTSLKELNLDDELLCQYKAVLDLQTKAFEDIDTPANQKAQVANSVASTLQSIVKMHLEINRDERLKRIENALLESVKTLPEKERSAFFERYEKIAEAMGATE